jgi:hypothetical protein
MHSLDKTTEKQSTHKLLSRNKHASTTSLNPLSTANTVSFTDYFAHQAGSSLDSP